MMAMAYLNDRFEEPYTLRDRVREENERRRMYEHMRNEMEDNMRREMKHMMYQQQSQSSYFYGEPAPCGEPSQKAVTKAYKTEKPVTQEDTKEKQKLKDLIAYYYSRNP